MLITAPITCVILDVAILYRFERAEINFTSILCYNISVMLFVGGIAALALLISKFFSTAGFATQIGSILYLVPIFLTLYLKMLEMKHNMAKTANQLYNDMEQQAGLVKKGKKEKKVYDPKAIRPRLNMW